MMVRDGRRNTCDTSMVTCACAEAGVGTYSWGVGCPGHRRRTTFSMMLATHLSHLSLFSGRWLLHSGHEGFLSIHLVMHSSQNRCAQFRERHGLRNISWHIPHLNSSISSSPPPIVLSVVHFSLSSSPDSVGFVASVDAWVLLLSTCDL
jgi:hypothetical protein